MDQATSDQAKEDKIPAFEAWKHFGSTGGADKDRMIQIVTWLLGFSAAIIGAQATGKLVESRPTALLSCLGIVISLSAAFVALLYGAYATWNWGMADKIAGGHGWSELLPTNRPYPKPKATDPLRLGEPCVGKIAPVFWCYCGFSLLSLAAHCVVLVGALGTCVELDRTRIPWTALSQMVGWR